MIVAKQEDYLEATTVGKGRAETLIKMVKEGCEEEDGFRIYSEV